MVIRELFSTTEEGMNLYRYYSNRGYLILQKETGITYPEAIDIETANYTYEETDILIEPEDGGEEITSEEFADMIEEIL